MRYLRSFVAIAAFVCFVQGPPASAQDLRTLGKLTKTADSVTKVMKKAGCSLTWVSQVVEDSGIDAAKLRQLPVGQRVLIRTSSSCKADAPARVASLSATLLRVDSVSARADVLLTELASMREWRDDAIGRLEGLSVERDKLKLEIAGLEKTLVEARKVPEIILTPVKPAPWYSYRHPAGIAMLMLSAAMLLVYSSIQWARREYRSMAVLPPPTWRIKVEGETHEFALVSAEETAPGSGKFIGRYHCPLCTERNLKGADENFRNHIAKHVRARLVVEVDPSLERDAGMTRVVT